MLELLIANRRLVADFVALAALVGALIWLDHHEVQRGRNEVQSKWDAQKAADQAAVDAAIAQAQFDIAMATGDLKAKLAERDRSTAAAIKGLKDEIGSNVVYSDCRITDGGMRLYGIAGGTDTDTGRVAETLRPASGATRSIYGFGAGSGNPK
jgi:hypothetical protein